MAAPAEQMVGIVDATDEPGLRLLPFLEPGDF